MTSRMYEEHFEHQILGLLHLTRKIKNAWFANEGVLDLDEMIQKLIEYHDINTYKLFNHCFGPMSSSFKTLPTTQQQKIIKFCGDIDLYVSFVNLLNSNDSEDVSFPESQLRSLSMMKPIKFHEVMNQYDAYLRLHLQQLPMLEVYLTEVLGYIPSHEATMIEKFKNDIQEIYESFLNQRDFSSIQYVLSDIHYRWNHSIGDVLRRYKIPNTKHTIYDFISEKINLSEQPPFEAFASTAMFDDIKDHHQYLEAMLKVRKECEGVASKNEVIYNILLDLDTEISQNITQPFKSGSIEECLVQFDDTTFQRQMNGKLVVQDVEIAKALGLVDGHIDLDKLDPAFLEKLPQHIFKLLALIAKDNLEKKLARYLEMMNTPKNVPSKENKKLPPLMQSNKKVRDNLMRLVMKHPMLYNAMTKQFIMRMLKFDKALMRKFMSALTPPVSKKEQWGKPDMKKVNKAFIEKVQRDVEKMNLDRQDAPMRERIEKNTTQLLKQSGLTASHPKYADVKSKLFKTYENIAQKGRRKVAKNKTVVHPEMLISTMKAELSGLQKKVSSSNQAVNHLLNMVKLNVVMREQGMAEKKIDGFKKEFKAISSENYSKTNNLFKPKKNNADNYIDKVKIAVKISHDKIMPRASKTQQLTKVLESFQKEGLFANWEISKFEKLCTSSTKLNRALSKQIIKFPEELATNTYRKPVFKRS